MDAAHIRKDVVWDRMQPIGAGESFKYHMDNKCYKKYVLKKSLEKIKVTTFCHFA